ncbi:MAG: AAA family ATPase [Acidimicrobiales bacterium]
MSDSTLVTRARIQNYKSIKACDVSLGPLSFLVGPNGAGKSNFLDALRFVADSLDNSVELALRERGGVNEVRRRSKGHPTHFGIRLEFVLASGARGHYAFRVGAKSKGGFEISDEECEVTEPEVLAQPRFFRVQGGAVDTNAGATLPTSADRLYLVVASSLPAFRPLFDALSRMRFYNLNPGQIRELQPPDAGNLLARDGWNLSSVLGEMAAQRPETKMRVEEYLAKVVSGVAGVDKRSVGPRETLEFRQQVAGSADPWRFAASNMSDGTLRALGLLVAIFQRRDGLYPPVSLVGIEEPEVALHPAAAGVLLDALREASGRVQVLVTSHSPDLLDNPAIPTEALHAVSSDAGVTTIGALDEVGRSALTDRLFTPGELLRLDQLVPDETSRTTAQSDQMRLFDTAPW